MMKRKKNHRMWKLLLGLFALGCIAGLTLFSLVCWRATVPRRAQASDCIVVLGARVYPDGRMSLVLRERVDAALDAWREGLAPNIIVCGARGSDEPRPEALAMAEYLIAEGIPEDRVIVDTASYDTRQNIANAAKIMRSKDWQSAIIVTSDYHLERALWMANSAGMHATGIAAPTPHTFRAWWWGRMRETISWVLYFIRAI